MDVAWAILKADPYSPNQRVMRPPIPSDAQEDREMRETVAGDSPQRRLNRFEERTGRPPSDKEMMLLINEQRAGVPEHESFSANYPHLDELFE